MRTFKLRYFSLTLVVLFLALSSTAQIPYAYYTAVEGVKDAALKTGLHQIIRHHTQLEYYSSSTHFRTTDWHPDGYFWDMYSDVKKTSWSGLNREHCMPKSWWSPDPEYTIAYSDLHNLYPSNPTANSAKLNYPIGEVGTNVSFDNGVSKVGNNTFSGYTGTVFEPADEYKGDFARTYMYMVTCYEDYSNEWRSVGTESMLNRNTYPVFRPYAVNLLLKWHRNDPVSDKELNRNDAVYSIQKNRNPFIDYPILAEYLWGNKKGNAWDSSEAGNNVQEVFYVNFNRPNRELMVKLTPASGAPYQVHAMDGRTLITGELSSATSTSVPLDDLSVGSYLITVQTPHNSYARIFLVF